MYFTREVAKRIKLNNDCVDDSNVWVSSNSEARYQGSLYQRWLIHMERRYPQFSIRVYRYFDRRFVDINNKLIEMAGDFDIDKERLESLYPEVWMVHPSFGVWVDKKIVVIDKRKLSWIYNSTRRNPIGVIGNV